MVGDEIGKEQQWGRQASADGDVLPSWGGEKLCESCQQTVKGVTACGSCTNIRLAFPVNKKERELQKERGFEAVYVCCHGTKVN